MCWLEERRRGVACPPQVEGVYMNLAELDRLISNQKDPEVVPQAMVEAKGIPYFEFPTLIQANRIRNELVVRQTEFQQFKENPNNKIFPDDELQGLKNQWKAVLRDVANKSGKSYRERAEWPLCREDINLVLEEVITAIANAMFPDEFVEAAGAPPKYDEELMNRIIKISDLQNGWTIREKYPVTFCEDDLDTWQDCIVDGSPKQYWLPRQRFKKLKGGIWVDKWATELLGKELRPNVKFLDRHAKWAEEYLRENPL